MPYDCLDIVIHGPKLTGMTQQLQQKSSKLWTPWSGRRYLSFVTDRLEWILRGSRLLAGLPHPPGKSLGQLRGSHCNVHFLHQSEQKNTKKHFFLDMFWSPLRDQPIPIPGTRAGPKSTPLLAGLAFNLLMRSCLDRNKACEQTWPPKMIQ